MLRGSGPGRDPSEHRELPSELRLDNQPAAAPTAALCRLPDSEPICKPGRLASAGLRSVTRACDVREDAEACEDTLVAMADDHTVLSDRFDADKPKWAALKAAPALKPGVAADLVLIDDHDQTSRTEVDVDGDGTVDKVKWLSHLKFARLTREADGKYTMTSTKSAKLGTNQSDASECRHHSPHDPHHHR